MKKFLITISLIIVVPLILLAGIYIWTDPFRCVHKFDIKDVDDTNREYLSTELFLRNNSTYHYNSFIFASSRGGGMNTYQWKQYLPEGAQPFLFQAWGETLTGMELKLEYLSEHNKIDNALLVIDIPGAFCKDQLPNKVLAMKHYIFTGHSKFTYNVQQYANFIQKPSVWKRSVLNKLNHLQIACCSDTITNDWDSTNFMHYTNLPPQDSLSHCSDMTRKTFLATVEHSKKVVLVSEPLINEQFESQLCHIKELLDAQRTDYHIILSPGYCYTDKAAHPDDIIKLNKIFGEERVHDYTGRNEMTEDYNNFSDPGHFGLRVGYMIIEDIYSVK